MCCQVISGMRGILEASGCERLELGEQVLGGSLLGEFLLRIRPGVPFPDDVTTPSLGLVFELATVSVIVCVAEVFLR